MAPYAVAHLKLGLLLQELGYRFEVDERLGIYLTNTLEEVIRRAELIFAQWIADEANAANEIKRGLPIMVVLGNPPYSGHSANRSFYERVVEPGGAYTVVVGGPRPEQQSVQRRTANRRMKVRESTFIGRLIEDYKMVDGERLDEKNPKWLQNDYVKFIRFGQWRIAQTGHGILAFITSNSYLDSPTFRGMRQNLKDAFTDIDLLNLHGNSKKKETSPDGLQDENVFDIQEGVAIGIFVKEAGVPQPAEVRYADLWGGRSAKYRDLSAMDCLSTPWQELTPVSPTNFFFPLETTLLPEYENGWKISEVMPVGVLGFQTHRDDVAVAFSATELKKQVTDYLGTEPDSTSWQDLCRRCTYRPFDERFVFLDRRVADRPRLDVNRHLFLANIALNLVRQTKADEWGHVLGSKEPTPAVFVEVKDGSSIFPLFLYAEAEDEQDQRSLLTGSATPQNRSANFSSDFLTAVEHKLGLIVPNGPIEDAGPAEMLFHYLYAVLHSPSFRERYREFLKLDFPRVPLTSDRALFAALAVQGAELMSIHLMESPVLSRFITRYEQQGEHLVEGVRYAGANAASGIRFGRVYINDKQYFDGVPESLWEFQIGGYQVCEKWLKDRKGRKLSSNDIDHYQKIVVALQETTRIMTEIDDLIPGWPLR